jgi:uracil-DNA glycosylase
MIPSTTKRLIGPEGSTSARIAIVGEAGGIEEERLGRPFVGSAGNLLEQCMHSAGIARAECYLTNVVKEKPAGNDIGPFYNEKGFSKTGLDYVQSLKTELADTKANIIVAVGNTALAALCDKKSVTKWRGSVLESTLLPGRKVIPIIHPASALREYLFKWYIIADLRRVRTNSMFPEINRVKRNIMLRPSFLEATAYIRRMLSEKQVGFDIEVVNQEVSCFCLAPSNTEAMVIPLGHRPNGYTQNIWTEVEELEIFRLLNELLNSPTVTIVGQNIQFDTSFLTKKYGIITRAKTADTMIGHHITYYDFPKGLDFICSIYADEPYYKDEGKIWKNPNVKDDEFWMYCGKDGCVTMEAWPKIEKEMQAKGTRATYDFTMELIEVLLYMQMRGIKADRTRLAETKELVGEKIAGLQAELDLKSGGLNPNSPKQCQEYFYIKLGYKPYISRKTGNITTDDKAMTKLERKGCREATLVKEIRGLKKLEGTYLDIEFDADGRLRCSYNAAGTTTGRLSSSQTIFGTGANFQNIPPEFKTFLVADDGYFLAEFDKRQAEWIETAFLSGDANMMEVVEKGLDAHVRTAQLMYGAPEELILKEAKIVGNSTDEDWIKEQRLKLCPEIFSYNPPLNMSMRQAAKKSNHGFNYDLSPIGFADANQMPLDDSKRCYAGYHKSYPGLKLWYKRTVEELQTKNRTLETFFGRRRWFGDRWSDDLFKQAYAYRPQSTVADMVNRALIQQHRDQKDYMKLVDLLGQVHDSELIQYPLDKLVEFGKAAVTIKQYLEPTVTYGGRSHVIPTDLKIGLDWGNMVAIKLSENPEEVSELVRVALEKLRG